MSISLASVNDVPEIMSFINSEWKEGHIMAKDQDFFLYEHQNRDQVNFVISKDKDMQINGVLGFIPTALDEDSDVATVIWKVAKNNDNPILGIQLLQYLKDLKGIRTVLSVGINKKTIGIYNYLGMHTNSLDQFVMLNNDILEFNIARVAQLSHFDNVELSLPKNYVIKPINDDLELQGFDFERYRQNIPFKNLKYFSKRYFHHLIYRYDIYGAFFKNEIVGLIVTRIQSYNESQAVRIVDFIGDEKCFVDFGRFIGELILKKGYEYADFYCFGLDKDTLNNAGFHMVDPLQDELIIPNYFAPFVQKNVPIYFFADTEKINNVKLFKADGDQDRPN
jgi:hypothetical protein